ncbi:MAG TPA: DNA-binding response regulator [Microscillaceae bacterium]|nr:DNA-binding response regulator [Microscillaceae bacterium]
MKQKAKILFVEDELALAMLVKDNLEQNGYEVRHCENGEVALKNFGDWEPDLVLLDVMMPKINGFEVAKVIRNKNRDIPILFLTAKIKASDVVQGFKSGGNDYLRKPFAMDELLIRMQALLSIDRLVDAPEADNHHIFELGKYRFDSKRLTIQPHNGETKKLTLREAELLKLLCQNQNKILTKTSILMHVWGDDSFFNSRSMDVFISRLRKYLKDDPSISLLNKRGVGYKLVTDG